MNNALFFKEISENNIIDGDFSGYGITRLYSLFKTNLATINSPIKISSKDDSITALTVNWNSDGKIDATSTTSTGTLLTNINDAKDYYINNLICQITGKVVGSGGSGGGSGNSDIIASNSLTSKNGETCIRFLNSGGLFAVNTSVGGIPELDEGNDFTIIWVSSIENGVIGVPFRTSNNSPQRINCFVDTRTQRRHTSFQNQSNNFFSTDNMLQIMDNNLRVFITTFDFSTKTLRSYTSGVFQDSQVVTGYIDNEAYCFGNIDGFIPAIAFCNRKLDDTITMPNGMPTSEIIEVTNLFSNAANI